MRPFNVDAVRWKYSKPGFDMEVHDKDGDYSFKLWVHPDGLNPPTAEEIAQIEREYARHLKSIEYIAKRRASYPPIQDALDALVHKATGDEKPWDDYVSACVSVKNRYPKGA